MRGGKSHLFTLFQEQITRVCSYDSNLRIRADLNDSLERRGRVFAFEPIIQTYARLLENISLNVTMPVSAPALRLRPARLTTVVDNARATRLSTGFSTSGRAANSSRNGHRNDSTHRRTGTRGNSRSTRCAAVSVPAPASLYLLHPCSRPPCVVHCMTGRSRGGCSEKRMGV